MNLIFGGSFNAGAITAPEEGKSWKDRGVLVGDCEVSLGHRKGEG